MNETNAPQETTQADAVRTVDQAELEIACVDLICHLENAIAVAKESGRTEHMNVAANTANNILSKLLSFSDQFFTGEEAEQTREEIVKALDESSAYTAVQKTRSWGCLLYTSDAADE